MTSLPASATGLVLPERGLSSKATFERLVVERLHDRRFWIVQGAIVVVTILHCVAELTGFHDSDLGRELAAQEVLVLLYLVPVVFAGLRFGLEGGLLAGASVVGLASPNLFLWHLHGYEWLGESASIVVVLAVGVAVAVPVERERQQWRRAEEASRRLAELEAKNARLEREERQRVQRFARAVLAAQEDERKRIARNLHDDVAQPLVQLGRGLGTLADHSAMPGVAAERADELRTLTLSVLACVRDFSSSLRPSALEDLGLVPTLARMARDVDGRFAGEVRFSCSGVERRLAGDVELAAWRISQEALRNVESHSGAAHAWLTLRFLPAAVVLTIEDDGRGIGDDAGSTRLVADGHLGIAGMRERADLVGGTFTTARRAGGGTTVRVVFADA